MSYCNICGRPDGYHTAPCDSPLLTVDLIPKENQYQCNCGKVFDGHQARLAHMGSCIDIIDPVESANERKLKAMLEVAVEALDKVIEHEYDEFSQGYVAENALAKIKEME